MKISSCELNEHIPSLVGDLGLVTVDNWWEGKHLACGIIENWPKWLIFKDVKVLLEFLVLVQGFEELGSC